MQCNEVELSTWKPETRQGGTLTLCGGQLHLIGGISKIIHSQTVIYHPMTKKWEKIETRGSQARYGHTTIEYDRNLIVFGGGTEYNQANKLRECINGIYQYHSNISEWHPLENKGVHISPRKFHAGCLIGKQFFIYGGLNNKNKSLNETIIYDFSRMGWIVAQFPGEDPGYRSCHTIQAILNPDQIITSLFSVPPTRYLNVKIPGLYMFGGLKEDGKACADLHILDLSSDYPRWVIPETTGPQPLARSNHTMLYISKLSILLVYGGKTHPNINQEVFLSDILMLRVDILHWNRVKMFGEIPCARSGHCMEAIGSRIFIFGGITKNGYCSSDLYIIELNPRNIRSYIQEEKHTGYL